MAAGQMRIAIAVVVLLLALGAILYQMRAPEKFPTDFPYAWIPAGTKTVDSEAIVIVRGTAPEVTSIPDGAMGKGIEVDGRRLYPAYTCLDPACPGRDVSGKTLLFAFDRLGDGIQAFSSCPACHPKTTKKTAPSDLGPSHIEAYVTPEGAAIVRRFSAKR